MSENLLSIDEIVAHNLRRAREAKGWTQEEAGRRLGELREDGQGWTKALWSQAELSASPDHRTRSFSVEELLAFSELFELPMPWFLEPPAGTHPDLWPRLASRDNTAELRYAYEVAVEAQELAETARAALDRISAISADLESVTRDKLNEGSDQ